MIQRNWSICGPRKDHTLHWFNCSYNVWISEIGLGCSFATMAPFPPPSLPLDTPLFCRGEVSTIAWFIHNGTAAVGPKRHFLLFTSSFALTQSKKRQNLKLADMPGTDSSLDIIFLGTGSSSGSPYPACIMKTPRLGDPKAEGACKTCLSTLDEHGMVKSEHPNVRGCPSAIVRKRWDDGRERSVICLELERHD